MPEPSAGRRAGPAAAVRCSVLSVQRDEPMLGTAFAEPGVLLVEQPGPWGHAGLSASRFDPAAAEALAARARAAGLRVLAIRRPAGGSDGPRRRWAIWRGAAAGGPPADLRAEHHRCDTTAAGLRWSDFGADAELLEAPLDGSVGELDPEPLYLVCAHSKRDVCCALRGRPLAAALAARRPGRVWECSHTGGHRFAPIVLAVPTGALYGRVPESGGAGALIDATERGHVIPGLLRGLIGFAPVEQAALGHLMVARSLADPRAVTVRSSAETAPGSWDVRLDVRGPAEPHAQWLVRLAVESVEISYASCAKPAVKAEREIRLVNISACHEQ